MIEGKYISVPGDQTHELPPLLVQHVDLEGVGELDSMMLEAEDMLAPSDADYSLLEQRKFDLAMQLAEQYRALRSQWQWGDSVLEWIRQCEITFEGEDTLRKLLHPDVWPHASRASFVELLREKALLGAGLLGGVTLEKAVGLRLTFRQPPPIDCFSSQFLFYLDSSVADSAYHTWSHLVTNAPALLPPERFHFDVLSVS